MCIWYTWIVWAVAGYRFSNHNIICIDRYFGLSSTGITYKSGSAALGSSSSRSGDRYGGLGNTRDGEALSDSYKERDQSGQDKFEKSTGKPHRGDAGDNEENTFKKGSYRQSRSVDIC